MRRTQQSRRGGAGIVSEQCKQDTHTRSGQSRLTSPVSQQRTFRRQARRQAELVATFTVQRVFAHHKCTSRQSRGEEEGESSSVNIHTTPTFVSMTASATGTACTRVNVADVL